MDFTLIWAKNGQKEARLDGQQPKGQHKEGILITATLFPSNSLPTGSP